MWCPKCKNEYREGITFCKNCNVDLVEDEPVDMIELCSYTDREIAEKVKEFFEESEDIDIVDFQENDDETFSIFVPKKSERKAIQMINAFMDLLEEEEENRRAEALKAAKKKKKKAAKKAAEDSSDETSEGSDDADVSDEDDEEVEESYDWDSEDDEEIQDIIGDEDFEKNANSFESDEDYDVESVIISSSKYEKKEDKYRDYKFSGFTFIIFGILGGVYLTLTKLEIIPIQYNIVVFCFICAVFAGFIIIGIRSLIKSGEFKVQVPEEQERIRVVTDWCEENLTDSIIEEWSNPDIDEAENDLLIMRHIREALLREFPDDEPGLLEMIAEDFYEERAEIE